MVEDGIIEPEHPIGNPLEKDFLRTTQIRLGNAVQVPLAQQQADEPGISDLDAPHIDGTIPLLQQVPDSFQLRPERALPVEDVFLKDCSDPFHA